MGGSLRSRTPFGHARALGAAPIRLPLSYAPAARERGF